MIHIYPPFIKKRRWRFYFGRLFLYLIVTFASSTPSKNNRPTPLCLFHFKIECFDQNVHFLQSFFSVTGQKESSEYRTQNVKKNRQNGKLQKYHPSDYSCIEKSSGWKTQKILFHTKSFKEMSILIKVMINFRTTNQLQDKMRSFAVWISLKIHLSKSKILRRIAGRKSNWCDSLRWH